MKTDFWLRLPWASAGLAYFEQKEAKAHFKLLAEQYDDAPGVANQHRVTAEFFGEGLVRSQLEEWAASSDSDLADCPEALAAVARWSVVPVVERSVEALHSLIKRGAGFRNVSAEYISLLLRWPEQKRRLHANPNYLFEMVEALRQLGSSHQLVHKLGLRSHPSLEQACSKHHTRFHAVANKVVYRMDMHSQFQKHSAAETAH